MFMYSNCFRVFQNLSIFSLFHLVADERIQLNIEKKIQIHIFVYYTFTAN